MTRAATEALASKPSLASGTERSAGYRLADRLWQRPLLLLAIAFLLSRGLYFALGVRFDESNLRGAFQFVDPELLRTDLVSSLWHLHTQPPLFNTWVGLVVQLGETSQTAVFHLTFLCLGLILTLALYTLTRLLGASQWLSFAAAIVFTASPSVVLFENWLYVDYWVAAALVVAAVCLYRFAAGGQLRYGVVFFGLLAGITLSRTFFSLAWFLVLVALVWLLQQGRRRQVILAASVPFALCALFAAKNLAMWGTVGVTCPGIQAAAVTTFRLDNEDVRRMVARGDLSRYALFVPWDLPERMPEVFRREPRTGVAILDRPVKSSGVFNLDHKAFLKICEQYMDDAITVARRRPEVPARAARLGALTYVTPSSQYFDRAENYAQIRPLEHAFAVAAGQPKRSFRGTRADPLVGLSRVAWLVVLGYLAALALIIRSLRDEARARRFASPTMAVSLYALVVLAYVTALAVGLGHGEANRFRLFTDPLVIAFLASSASRAWSARRGRSGRATGALARDSARTTEPARAGRA